jgi:hypothetical protein
MDSSFLSFLLTFSHTFHSSSIQSVVFAIHLQITVLLGGIQKQTKKKKKRKKRYPKILTIVCVEEREREREREREMDGWLVGGG